MLSYVAQIYQEKKKKKRKKRVGKVVISLSDSSSEKSALPEHILLQGKG